MKHASMVALMVIIFAVGFTGIACAQSSTATNTIEARVPEGQLISFRYEAGGQLVVCGIHVKKLAYKHPPDASFFAVQELELVNNKLECKFGPGDNDAFDSTLSDVDYTSGRILMTVAKVVLPAGIEGKLPFSKNRKYKLTITTPFSGTMVPFPEKPASPQKKQ